MDSITNYFDEMAPIWDNAVRHNKIQIRDIIKLSNMNEGDKVLDIGSGTGVLVDYIREVNKSGEIYEIDNSQKMLNMARAKNYNDKHIRFLKMNIEDDLLNEIFDVIIFYNTLPYINNKSEMIKNISNKNLRVGGRIVIFHNNGEKEINLSHSCGDKRICSAYLPSFDHLLDSIDKTIMSITYTNNIDNNYSIILTKRV